MHNLYFCTTIIIIRYRNIENEKKIVVNHLSYQVLLCVGRIIVHKDKQPVS